MALRRLNYPDEIRAVDRARYYRDYAKRRAAMDAYASNHRAEVNANKRRWYERNREKAMASQKARRALKKELIVKAEACALADETCTDRMEMHHEDYAKPLEVTWLCSRHHGETRRRQTR